MLLKRVLIGLLLLVSQHVAAFAVDQGAMDLSQVTLSRSSGYAPLNVFFDGSGITDAGVTARPFLDLDCRWDFGDTASGSWGDGTTGAAGTGAHTSRNLARGLVAAHVFETPGTYTVTLRCTDGTHSSGMKQFSVTVSNPDGAGSPFLGAGTVCIANTTAVAGQGGCPASATTPAGTTDFAVAMSYQATGTRILLKRGDTFYSTATAAATATGPVILGAYGTGAKPIIRKSGSPTSFIGLSSSSQKASDWRIMDLEFDGACTTTCSIVAMQSNGSHSNMTLLRLYIHDVGAGITWSGSGLDALNKSLTVATVGALTAGQTTGIPVASVSGLSVGMGAVIGYTSGGGVASGTTATVTAVGASTIDIDTPVWQAVASSSSDFYALPLNPAHPMYSGAAVVDSTIERVWNSSGGICLYPVGRWMNISGNLMSDSTQGEHVMRSQGIDRGVVNHNTLQHPAVGKYVFTLRAFANGGGATLAAGAKTQYVVVSDNKFVGNGSVYNVSQMPQNATADERHQYVVWERNLIVAGSGTTTLLSLWGSQQTVVRNNVFDCSAKAGCKLMSIEDSADTVVRGPASEYVEVYNNTGYTAAATGSALWAFNLPANTKGTNHITLANNLVYSPNVTATNNVIVKVCASSCGAGGVPSSITANNNTADNAGAGSSKTNPGFASATPAAFGDFALTCTGSTYPCGQGVAVPVWSDATLKRPAGTPDLGAFAH